MSINHVPASAGVDWVGQALALARRWPAVFPVMGLIIAALGMIPYIGSLIGLILGPALIGGTVAAAHTADRGGSPSIGQTFQAFQQGDRTTSMVALCIPFIVAFLIAGVVVFVFAVGTALSGGMADAKSLADNPAALLATFGVGLLLLIPLCIVLLFAAYAFTFFAIPRAMLDGQEAFPAMRESFAAARANIGAFVVSSVLLLVGSWVLLYVLNGLLRLGWVGDLLVSGALYTLLGSTLYYGAKAVLGSGGNALAQDSTPPPASESPPPPPTA